MSKLFFKMEDFGIHESVSYDMRDRLAAKMQAKFDKWYEENVISRKFGGFTISEFGEMNYAIYPLIGEHVIISKIELETLLGELYEKKRARRSNDSDTG